MYAANWIGFMDHRTSNLDVNPSDFVFFGPRQ
jgi:hypothetical protein